MFTLGDLLKLPEALNQQMEQRSRAKAEEAADRLLTRITGERNPMRYDNNLGNMNYGGYNDYTYESTSTPRMTQYGNEIWGNDNFNQGE